MNDTKGNSRKTVIRHLESYCEKQSNQPCSVWEEKGFQAKATASLKRFKDKKNNMQKQQNARKDTKRTN